MSRASPRGISIDSGTMQAQNLIVVHTADQKSLAMELLPNSTVKFSSVPTSSGKKDVGVNSENAITMPKISGKTKNIAKQTAYGPRKVPTDKDFLARLLCISRV